MTDRLISDSPCIIWHGTIDKSNGYGRWTKNDGNLRRHAHRVIWEKTNGPVPSELVLDHLCRNRACVNVNHLEPVKQRVNVMRGVGLTKRNAEKTVCHRGHPFDEQNTHLWPGRYPGTIWRQCKRCHADAMIRKVKSDRAKRRMIRLLDKWTRARIVEGRQ